MNYFNSIYLMYLILSCKSIIKVHNKTLFEICPVFNKGPSLNVPDLVGSWMTVYTQPEAVDCFKFNIRATTELEREQYIMKYGNFSDRVFWSMCLLQVETPLGKHFLQGNGSQAGLMENIIIYEDQPGEYWLQNESADQWIVYGRRGSEVLIIRDCNGETAAAFARAPYWPTMPELSALFHRSGITAQIYGRSLCEPREVPAKEYYMSTKFNRKAGVRKSSSDE